MAKAPASSSISLSCRYRKAAVTPTHLRMSSPRHGPTIWRTGIAPWATWLPRGPQPRPYFPVNYIFVNGRYWRETNQPWSNTAPFVGTCTTGSTEPTFNNTVTTYTDNNCTWTNVG